MSNSKLKSPSKLTAFKSRSKQPKLDAKALQDIQNLLNNKPKTKDLLIEYLHLIQDEFNYISAEHLAALAAEMRLSQVEVYEVASFYHHFKLSNDPNYKSPKLTIRVCQSLTCQMLGAKQLTTDLQQAMPNNISIQLVPCVGRCDQAPIAVVADYPVETATVEKVNSAINEPNTETLTAISYQLYLKTGGYQTYQKYLNGEISTDKILTTLEQSGIRGLGGAGFPVAKKWRIVKQQPNPKLMAVNIDEGEPGTFKDKFYLQCDPHRFLEGMLIAAACTGINEIYIYIRDEYTAIRHLLITEIANLQQLTNSKPLPKIHLRRGAGAYICGEESAMIESIEGKRGMPRLRPPFVAEVGLFGRPTLEHNMESLYWVRDILNTGAEYLTKFGRNGRVGLRSFSVSGRINNPGVHLAPAGITIQQLIDEYCDGMQDGHEFYGYFPGGASGGILPASLNNIPLDFDTLQQYGCFIGSAAVIIFSTADSAKDLALNAMQFFKDESCGQCTPCRVGTAKACDLMQQPQWNNDLLTELSGVMAEASICGLGQAAANPILSTIKYFPQELN